MSDRKLRHTLSAAAWMATMLCALSLLASAVSVAGPARQASAATAEASQK